MNHAFTINDSHCHFFSHVFLKAIAGQRFGEGDAVARAIEVLGWESPPQAPSDLARRWIEELDRNRVRRSSLIASVPRDEDSVAAAVKLFPERFVGFFMVDPTQPDALERVGRAVSDLKLRCACFFPAMHRYPLHDERLRRLLDLISKTDGCAVFVHCGVLTVGIRKKLGLPSSFDFRLGNPLDLSLIVPGYPQTPFIIPHLGAGFLREALMAADVCPNIYLDTSSSNSWVRYLGITLREAFRRALAVAGPGRLLFGTDSSFFPRGWQRSILDEQLTILSELKVGPSDTAAILGGNFDRLFPVSRSE
ncbi:MAG TPA: amidohydrolase family protein [Acidobacteriota bacterium]|jgi:hypothetical protein